MPIDNPISFIVENQIPEFIRSDMDGKYANFVAFVKAYYEWMEQENGVTAESRSLLSYADVDKTTDEFIKQFVYKFLPYFPEDLVNDRAKLIKTINDFYAKKGSLESLKFLFRVVYNEDIDVFFPKENILKASDGKWRIPKTLRLTVGNTATNFDLSTIKKRLAIGRDSRATCVIESAYRTIDAGTGAEIFEVYVSNVKKTFNNGEFLDVQYIDDDGNQGILLSERIIGSLSNLKINPRKRGLRYKVGDPVVFIGGLSDDPAVPKQEARAIVDDVTDGRLQTVGIVFGGYGFRISPNTEVDVINAPADTTGTGAEVEVEEITNGETFVFNNDSIYEYKDIALNAANYGFPNLSPSTISSTLGLTFSYESVTVGTVSKVTIKSSGTKYTEVPTIDVGSYYDTSNSENYFNSVINLGNESYRDDWESTRQNFLDLGKLANVQIIRGGSGYSTTNDKIYVNRNGGGGYGANITFTVDGAGTITTLTLVSRGEGYNGPKGSVELIVANSANIYASSAGSGAILKAYRYGEGDNHIATVDDVGRIKSFKLLSRGSGYVATPNVSLKIKDIAIAPLDVAITSFDEGQIVYQGPNTNASTFIAYVDGYTPASGSLRVYNYNGTLNTSANLIVTSTLAYPTYNVNAYSIINTFGDGTAKANAEFLNGIINYDGYFLNTDGFLSADKVLQDSRKYHNFSYVVLTEQSLTEYKNMLMDILHPTGTKMFGKKKIVDIVTTGFGFS